MKKLLFDYTRERLFPGFDNKTCKVNPKMMYDGKNTAFMFWEMNLLSGSDVFVSNFVSASHDGGKTFETPEELPSTDVYKDGIRSCFAPICVYYNKFHKKWISLCFRIYYENDKYPLSVSGISVGEPIYTEFDPQKRRFINETVSEIPMPFETICAVPHGQIIEYENGDMLLSFYVSSKAMPRAGVLTARYALTENGLELVRSGTLLVSGDEHERGFCEPSVARLADKYYMTIRTDEVGLLAVSDDGFTFSDPQPWRWDNGEILENYNTMQRWVRFSDGLFLAYTRRGAHNDHVFRHRAPMFMARFDEDRMCLIRDTEVILVPETGARLGNYSITDISENESWLTTAEWMQPVGCERYGSDNSLWIAKVKLK